MDVINGLATGFGVALQPENVMYVAIGVLLGTVIGMLPGLGPTASIAVLLPITFHMDAASAVIMVAGIYYGGMYGGRIPAILLNLPGDSSSVITTLDGYPLTKQGRAGAALSMTAIASFIGGTIAIVGLTIFAPIVANVAVRIGAQEMFVLALAGLLMVAFIGSGRKIKALLMAGLGLLLASVGMDPISGIPRFTFGSLDLYSGIHIVPLVVGLFGLGEMLFVVDRGMQPGVNPRGLGRVMPTMTDWVESRVAIVRAALIGFVIGVMPGGGGALSSIVSYGVQKRVSKNPEKFGKGAMDGLTATETADNASSNSAFIPLLTLGLPPNPVLAVIFGVLLIQNITPGPRLIDENPEIFWGVIASMYVGNVMLLILNLPLIRVFVQILRIRGSLLFPVVVVIAFAGVYSANNSFFDVGLAIVFGVVGYLLKKAGFDLAPLILAFILGPIMESEFRRSMLLSSGDLATFVVRPGSGTLLALVVGFLLFALISFLRGSRGSYRRGVVINDMGTTEDVTAANGDGLGDGSQGGADNLDGR